MQALRVRKPPTLRACRMSGFREGENASYNPDEQVFHLLARKGGFCASVQPNAFRLSFHGLNGVWDEACIFL